MWLAWGGEWPTALMVAKEFRLQNEELKELVEWKDVAGDVDSMSQRLSWRLGGLVLTLEKLLAALLPNELAVLA